MSNIFSLEIISKESIETIQATMVDLHSNAGSFLIYSRSAPLVSIIGNKTSLIITLTSGATKTIPLTGGILRIDQKGDVSILILEKTTEF